MADRVKRYDAVFKPARFALNANKSAITVVHKKIVAAAFANRTQNNFALLQKLHSYLQFG